MFETIKQLVYHGLDLLPDDLTLLIIPALALLSSVFIVSKVASFLWLLVEIYALSGIPLSRFGLRGSWVVITGASDGIGKEYAHQLARRGYNLLLISRTKQKLDGLAQNLSSKYPNIRTKTIAIDFSNTTEEDWAQISQVTDPLDVGILINNVGVSHEFPVPFCKTNLKEIRTIIEVNCYATLRMTHIIASNMIDRRRGLILNMASFAGVFPTPLLATYAGSKSFLSTWSTALGAELSPYGITVNCVQSHLVVSSMSKIRQPDMLVPTAKLFVRDTLAKIGRGCGSQAIPYNSTPYWTHAIMQWTLETFLGRWNPILLWFNKSMHESIRHRALAKQERQKKQI